MARYSWSGRTANGSVVKGVKEAASRDVVIAQLKAAGITTTSVTADGPEDISVPALPGAAASAPPPATSQRGRRFRENLFNFGAISFFSALGIGAACLSPVLDYHCRRDAAGDVSCHIQRRVLRLVPLAPVDASHILSASTKRGVRSETMSERSQRLRMGSSEQSYVTLSLICTSGPCWTSESSSPIWDSNDSIESGISNLLASATPADFEARQAERVPLIVFAAFQIPLGIILFAGLLRHTVFRGVSDQQISAFSARMSQVAARMREDRAREERGEP